MLSRDSWEGELSDPRTLHKYGYAGGNPITHIDPSGNSFMALFLEASTINYVMLAAVALTAYSAINSVNVATALSSVASEAITAAAKISSEILGAAIQALNILKAEVNEELNRRKNELDRWQLILQMPSGLIRKPESYTPPLGSSSFIVKQFEGDRMRVLGARLKQRNGPINELIARIDYHPLPREFPNHPYTLHYHLGPNSNGHRHYVIYPENRIVD